MKTFSIKEAIAYGYNGAKANWQVISVALLASYIVRILIQLIAKSVQGNIFAVTVITIVSVVFSFFVSVAMVRVAILEGRGQKMSWKDIVAVQNTSTYVRFLLTCLWVMVIMFAVFAVTFLLAAVGSNFGEAVQYVLMLVGVLAGLYISIRLRFAIMASVDVSNGVSNANQSVKQSWSMTRNVFWRLVGFYVLAILINILGAIVLLVGLFFTIPLTLIAGGHIYNKLK